MQGAVGSSPITSTHPVSGASSLVSLPGGPVAESFEVAFFEDRNANGTFESGTDNLLGVADVAGCLAE